MSPLAALLAAALAATPQETEEVTARVTYVTASGVFVDAGREQGLRVGDQGSVQRGGREIARVEVKAVSSNSCQAASVFRLPDHLPAAGDDVVFRLQRLRQKTGAAPAEGGEPAEDKEFVPLLAPWERPETATVRPVFHGNVRLGTSWIHDQEYDEDYGYHQLSSSGAGERLFGGAWSLEWSLNTNVRSGSGYDGHPDDGDLKVRADQLVLRYHGEDGTVIGMGRILPLALPAYGRLDGVSVERPLEDGVRVGVIAGLRPDRDDLGFNSEELVFGAYGVLEPDVSDEWSVWVSPGVLASWFEGATDQQALLLDAGLRNQSGTWMNFTSQVDVYSGSEDSRSGLGLTRMTLNGGVPLGDVFSVRAGWHQYQLPDTDGQRDLIPSDALYTNGHRRVSATLIERLGDLGLEQEVAHVAGSGQDDDVQVTVRAYQSGLPVMGTADVSAYTLAAGDTDGFGLQAGYGMMPMDRLYARLAATYNDIEPDGFSSQSLFDLSLQTDWQATTDITVSARAGWNFGDEVDALMWDLSVMWRF